MGAWVGRWGIFDVGNDKNDDLIWIILPCVGLHIVVVMWIQTSCLRNTFLTTRVLPH